MTKDGTLPAIRVGKVYRIRKSDLECWVKYKPRASGALRLDADIASLLDDWLQYLRVVRAHSPNTIRTHREHIRGYLKRLAGQGSEPLVVTNLFDRN
jgi:hypothetical protein